MTTQEDADTSGSGSWLPLIVIFLILFMRWAAYGEGRAPVRTRRWYNSQRVQWRKRLGYRDASVYKGGAGEGASSKSKRQG